MVATVSVELSVATVLATVLVAVQVEMSLAVAMALVSLVVVMVSFVAMPVLLVDNITVTVVAAATVAGTISVMIICGREVALVIVFIISVSVKSLRLQGFQPRSAMAFLFVAFLPNDLGPNYIQ